MLDEGKFKIKDYNIITGLYIYYIYILIMNKIESHDKILK